MISFLNSGKTRYMDQIDKDFKRSCGEIGGRLCFIESELSEIITSMIHKVWEYEWSSNDVCIMMNIFISKHQTLSIGNVIMNLKMLKIQIDSVYKKTSYYKLLRINHSYIDMVLKICSGGLIKLIDSIVKIKNDLLSSQRTTVMYRYIAEDSCTINPLETIVDNQDKITTCKAFAEHVQNEFEARFAFAKANEKLQHIAPERFSGAYIQKLKSYKKIVYNSQEAWKIIVECYVNKVSSEDKLKKLFDICMGGIDIFVENHMNTYMT